MNSPALADLPPPPPGKTGWPWTFEAPPLPDMQPDGKPWPRISIVTPSYNQGQFIEETIRSVLLQGYPNLEYTIIDGGSTDDTVEVIRKYERHLTRWVSEKDRGQSHAINKGLASVTGDVWAYINSDDIYTQGAFAAVAAEFVKPGTAWVTGDAAYVSEDGQFVRRIECKTDWRLADVVETFINEPVVVSVQPSNFMSRAVLREFSFYNESLHYCMDVDLQLKLLLAGAKPSVVDDILCHARLHGASKTVSVGWAGRFVQERALILERMDAIHAKPFRLEIDRALVAYRRLEIHKSIRDEWAARGRWHATWAVLQAIRSDPSLVGDRPILGLARRILLHDRPLS